MSVDGLPRPSQVGAGLFTARTQGGMPDPANPLPQANIPAPSSAPAQLPAAAPDLSALVDEAQLQQLKSLLQDTTQGLQGRGDAPDAEAADGEVMRPASRAAGDIAGAEPEDSRIPPRAGDTRPELARPGQPQPDQPRADPARGDSVIARPAGNPASTGTLPASDDAPVAGRTGEQASTGRAPTLSGNSRAEAAMLAQRPERRGVEAHGDPNLGRRFVAGGEISASVEAGAERPLSSQTDSDARTGRSSSDSPLPRQDASARQAATPAADTARPAKPQPGNDARPAADPQPAPRSEVTAEAAPDAAPRADRPATDAPVDRRVQLAETPRPTPFPAPNTPVESDPDLARLAQFFADDRGPGRPMRETEAQIVPAQNPAQSPAQNAALNPALSAVAAGIAGAALQQQALASAAQGQSAQTGKVEMRRMLWIALLVAAAVTGGLLTLILVSPAQAGNFTPPNGCRLEMTVQLRSCVVAQQYRCSSDQPGDQRVMYFGKNGPSYMSLIDRETRWLESEDMVSGLKDYLEEGGADDASFSTLLETGRDDFDFWTRSNSGERLHHQGHDELTGETVVIDGQSLEVTRFELTTRSESGEVLIRRSGQQFVSRQQGRFYGGVERSEDWTGQARTTNDSPVLFAGPGQPGFGETTPQFDCEMQMVGLDRLLQEVAHVR